MSKRFLALTSLVAVSLFLSGCSGGESVTLDQSSAEVTVQGFYDAMIAGDTTTALKYIDPSVVETEDFQSTWNEVSEWTYKSVTVTGFEDPYVGIEMTIEYEGDEESGTDEVEVVESDGAWWIVDLPS